MVTISWRLAVLPVLLLCVTSTWIETAGAEPLNDYILDYQPVTLNPIDLIEKHSRVKRFADPYLRLNFKAYGRKFNLRLEPDTSVFASDHHLVVDDDTFKQPDTSHIYSGVVTGESGSSVHVSVHNASLWGHIWIPGQPAFHLEPAYHHLEQPAFHTIIYPESHMNLDPYRHKRAASSPTNGNTCYSQFLYDKLKSMSEEVDVSKKRDNGDPHQYAKYSEELNKMSSTHRVKRSLDGNKKTCFMSIRADKLLFDHIKAEKTGGDEAKARDWIVAMFANHIAAITAIYESTNFKPLSSSQPSFLGIRFQLRRSTIITECVPGKWDPKYCTGGLDVSNYLDLTSRENHDDFCLVHTFTYRDFLGGTLGLAWVANPQSSASGVCGKNARVNDNGVIASKSLNTGITTLINFNREVATRVSQLTFAHEVGHNFGAKHDATQQCAPYGTTQPDASDGNYIMYPSANTGNLPHNSEFSPCSRDYVAKVLNTMPGVRAYCFEESDAKFCGNNVVEDGEQCDCGYEGECKDACCHPRYPDANNINNCKLKGSVVCSPSEGPCCEKNCTYSITGTVCLSDSECAEQSTCVSRNATCPSPKNKPDKETFCDNFGRVCESGQCIGSVCKKIGWQECFIKDEKECYVSCQLNNLTECISSFNSEALAKSENSKFKELLDDIMSKKGIVASGLGLKRAAASLCNFGKGYCDVFSKCRSYDAEGPFKQLTKLIFNPVTLKNIEDWVVDNWWAVLLIGVGVIVFMTVFVKIFGYNTPNEDPKKKRRAQPMPRTNPQADKRAAPKAQTRNRRPEVYTTDVPMAESRPHYGRGQGHHNQGYHHDYPPGYQQGGYGAASRGQHQQFDRINGQRHY